MACYDSYSNLLKPAGSSERQMNKQEKMISWILRLLGFLGMFAVLAVIMPFGWMLSIHEFLGLGKMPEAPVVEYLARSLSAFYAMVSVIFWYVSFRVREHWKLVRVLAYLFVAFGVVSWWVDVKAGMPLLWTLQEAPPMIAVGLVILYLQGRGSQVPGDHSP